VGQPTSACEVTVIVPDEEKLHWRLVSTTIKLLTDHFDLYRLNQRLGAATTGPLVQVVLSSASQTSYSRAFISPIRPEEGRHAYIFQIDTYRLEGPEEEQPPRELSETQFFDALLGSIHDVDQLQIISVADLYYPAAQADWRMKLLADPPRLEELQSGIGKISLSGVTLRFSDSPHGLLESFLAISPDEDEYRCSLSIINHIRPDELPTVQRTVLNQAEELARLFVDVKGEA
jgi:hypothetical protein